MNHTMNITRHIRLCLLIALALIVPVQAEDAPADNAAAGDQAKTIAVRDAVRELAAEAHKTLEVGGPFARDASNYAETSGTTVDSDDLLKALSSRLDPQPAVDGYIKWQLLSYGLPWSELSPRDLIRVIDGLPAWTAMGQPDRRIAGMLSRYDNRTPTPAEQDNVRQLVDQFAKNREQLRQWNHGVEAYHNAIIGRVPEANAMKVFAHIASLERQLAAGDPESYRYARRVVGVCASVREDPTLSTALRRELVRRLNQAARHETTVIGDIKWSGNGPFSLVRTKVRMSPKLVEEAQAYLMGREPPKDK